MTRWLLPTLHPLFLATSRFFVGCRGVLEPQSTGGLATTLIQDLLLDFHALRVTLVTAKTLPAAGSILISVATSYRIVPTHRWVRWTPR